MYLKVRSVRKAMALASCPWPWPSPLPFPSAFLDFFFNDLLFIFIYVSISARGGAAAFGGQRCQTILELESQAAVTCLVLVLGNKLGSSTGAACALTAGLSLQPSPGF